MEHSRAIVLIDHGEAHVVHFNPGETDELIVHSTHCNAHLRRNSGHAAGCIAPGVGVHTGSRHSIRLRLASVPDVCGKVMGGWALSARRPPI
jgi:hypothetical protein